MFFGILHLLFILQGLLIFHGEASPQKVSNLPRSTNGVPVPNAEKPKVFHEALSETDLYSKGSSFPVQQ